MLEWLATRYELGCRTVLMLLVVNAAMIVFTLRGGVILGFFPAVAAAHAVFREWSLDRSPGGWAVSQTWSAFATHWRSERPTANATGWSLTAAAAVLVADLWIVRTFPMGYPGLILSGALVVVATVFALASMLVWPVRAHFDESQWWCVRTAVQLVIARPLCSTALIAVISILIVVFSAWPPLMILLGLAAPPFASCAVVRGLGRIPGWRPADARELDILTPENPVAS